MKFNLIFILALISEILCAQINKHKYFGTIILENNAPMSFSLDLIEKILSKVNASNGRLVIDA